MQRTLFILTILLFFLVMVVNVVGAVESPDLVWIIIDQTSIRNIIRADTHNIDYLQSIGAFGLINVRTVDHLLPGSTYLSAGAGNRCKGSKNSHVGQNINGEVINNKIDNLKELNKDNSHSPQIGLIGTISRKQDFVPAVIGNTDNIFKKKRTIVSLVMDDNGYVPMGDVSKSLLNQTDESWGYETDWDKMKELFLKYCDLADGLVIETGDITRIEDFRHSLSNKQLSLYKRNSLEKIDDFIGFILEEIDLKQTQIGIIVPTPSPEEQVKGSKLSFVLFSGKKVPHGWLTSLSTRRRGIITISDLAPSFFNAARILDDGLNLTGNGFDVKEDKVKWNDLDKLNRKITVVSNLRPLFVKGFIVLQLVVIIMAIVNMIWKRVLINVIIQNIFEYLLLALLLVPFNYLIISIFYFASAWHYTFLLIGITIIELYGIIRYTEQRLTRVIIITIVFVLVVVFDLLNNYILMSDSLLGYSSIIGARYYGLGNEYMGLFVGGVLIGLTGLLDFVDGWQAGDKYSWIILFPLFISTYFVGASSLGANFGGMITIISASIFTWVYIKKINLSLKNILYIIFISITILLIIVYFDYSRFFGPRSHIGRIVKPLINGNFQLIKQIIKRKLLMNLKLLRWTIWTRVLLGFLIYLVIIFNHPVGKLRELFNRYPYLAAGFYGSIGSAVVTMFVNDSGVVAAATLLFFPMLTLLYLIQNLSNIKT